MKFDEKTLKVLSNYASIDHDFYFLPGSTLIQLTTTKTIYARATISDNITEEFATHNLPKLVSILKLFREPNVTIEQDGVGDVMVISEGDRVARFTLSEKHLIKKPPTAEVKFARDVPFKLSSATVQELKNAATSFGHTDLVFHAENGKIIVETTIAANPTSDRFRVVVGETKKKFRVGIKLSNFVVLNEDYEAAIAFTQDAHGKPTAVVGMIGGGIEYYIATEAKDRKMPVKEALNAA